MAKAGYPVHVYQTWRRTWFAGTDNSKFYLRCGHEHVTHAQASKCLPAMIERYKALRWPKAGV